MKPTFGWLEAARCVGSRPALVPGFILLSACYFAAPAAGGTYEAPLDVNKGGAVKFTAKPQALRSAEKIKISFAVSQPTDVEVAVLDSASKVVRHLAAGLLGKNAPGPFKKNSLAQEITWDGRDDLGKVARRGPFKVRVRIGVRPELERIVGWDGQTLGAPIVSIAVGKGGEVYVLLSDFSYGRTAMRVLDRTGKYLRSIIPYPGDTPAERTASIGHLQIDGERLPIVFNGHGGNTLPMTAGMKYQTMAFHPKGHLLLVSAVGTMAEHGPPRHLLALHPQGGAPEGVGFVGPQIRRARGFMGGAGERGTFWFDHLATSPDGEWIYLTIVGRSRHNRGAPQAVYRLKWTDKKLGAPWLGKKEFGRDDQHLNDPHGLATDAKGNLYVCDRGNHRVVIFSAAGKLLRKFSVESPQQIAVGPGDGAIYVLSRLAGKGVTKGTLLKFSAPAGGEPKELARLAGHNIQLMALDGEADPPKLWAVTYMGRAKGQQLVPITDSAGKLEPGKAVNNADGLKYPMFLAADPARSRVLIRERGGGRRTGLKSLDLVSGKITSLGVRGADVALDRAGNLYVLDGYATNSLSRYGPTGKPLPFTGTGSHKIKTGAYRGYGPDLGLRGHCVSLAGDIYLIRSSNYGGPGVLGARVDVFSPDGRLRKRNLIDGLGYGDCGLGVDAAGNVYVGANVKPAGQPFPKPFMGKVPAMRWAWWHKGRREFPWRYPYINAYLFHWGSVFKFPPAGGAFYGHPFERKLAAGATKPDVFFVDRAPAGAASYRSAYLGREIKVVGALWRYAGCGIIPSSSDGLRPDPGCVCWTSRLAIDTFGRVYAPNVFRFSVEMLDTNGNQLARIGRYGNADSAGPGSPVPEPAIAFAWPAFVSVADGKVYVCDSVNRRVTVIKLGCQAEHVCALK